MNRLQTIVTAFSAGAVLVQASSVVRLDFVQLSRSADRVVAGKILNIAPELDAATGYIYSNVTLSATHSIPADRSGRPLQFRVFGGEFGGRKLQIADLPELKPGQEVVLFLNRETSGVLGPTVGLWQGIFFVERDGASGEEQVSDHARRPVLGIRGGQTILGLSNAVPSAHPKPSNPSALTVDQLMQHVRTARSTTAAGQPK